MDSIFYHSIELINSSASPIRTAWDLSLNHLEMTEQISPEFTNKLLIGINQLDNLNPYHNHYHCAHVLYSSAYLLKKEGLDSMKSNAIPLLLAGLFHDALHPGRSNLYPYELENLSLATFKVYCQDMANVWKTNPIADKLSWLDVFFTVEKLIPATEFIHEPKQVAEAYKKGILEEGIQISTLKMLLIESDILLSVLPMTGYQQTLKILQESSKPHDHTDILNSWKGFLTVAINEHYISHASKGIKENVLKLIPLIEEAKNVTSSQAEVTEFLEKHLKALPITQLKR